MPRYSPRFATSAGAAPPATPLPAPPRAPRTRLDPEQRRAEVLDQAVAAFAEHGFARTTFADVAARSGLSKGAVYHYFETKEALFEAVITERLVPRIAFDEAAIAADGETGDVLIEQMMRRLWDTMANPADATLALIALLEMPQNSAVAETFYRAVTVRGRDAFHAAFTRAVAAGRLPPDLPVDSLAWAVPPTIIGTVLLLQSIGRLHDPPHADALARRCKADMLAVLMAGLRAGTGARPTEPAARHKNITPGESAARSLPQTPGPRAGTRPRPARTR